MPAAHQITKLKVQPVQISVSKALANAQTFARAKVQDDDQMFAKWISGDVEYNDLKTYFDARLKTAFGVQADNLESLKLQAKERKQNIEDEFHWNEFLAGHLDAKKYKGYLETRMGEEQEGTPGSVALQSYQTGLTEKVRSAEEQVMAQRYTTGQISYEQFKDFLSGRAALYPEGSGRRASLDETMLVIEPQFRIGELERLYAQGYWGNRKGDGTYDFEANQRGYLQALQSESNRYGTGTPQRSAFDQAISNLDATIRTRQFQKDVSRSESNANRVFADLSSARNELLRAEQLQSPNTEEWRSYVASLEETYNQMVENINNLKSDPSQVTQIPSSLLKPVAAPATPVAQQAGSPTSAPPAATSPYSPPTSAPKPSAPKPTQTPIQSTQQQTQQQVQQNPSPSFIAPTDPNAYSLFVRTQANPTVFGVTPGGQFVAFQNEQQLNSVLGGKQVQTRDALNVPKEAVIFGDPTRYYTG